MSVDTHASVDHGHHDSPEVVDVRNRMAIWLLIAGDAIILGALFFTYLYLRGLDTGGHWMSMVGYQGHSYAWYENMLNGAGLPAATLIKVGTLSAKLNWLGTLLTVVSAGIIWFAEKTLRSSDNRSAFSALAWLGTLVVLVGLVVSVVQLKHIPQIFVANNDSQTMSYTAYDSSMMILIGSTMVHQFILAFLGVGVALRAARGVLTGQNFLHARLVRIFWVWVAVAGVATTLLTTTINVIH